MRTDAKTPALAREQAKHAKVDARHSTIESALSEALTLHGVTSLPILADGRFHRFDTPDKPNGKRNGWYKVHSPHAASYGIHHLDLAETVTLYGVLDPEAVAQARRDAQRQRDEQERQRKQQWGETANKARSLWSEAGEADPDHPYLTRKRVLPHGLRQHGNTLLVPLFFEGELVNLERIYPNGFKATLPYGRVTGVASLIGHIEGAGQVLIVEGWATGAALHEAVGYPVVVARNADNLEKVARRLRQRLPDDVAIGICGDDDRHLDRANKVNKGRIAARHTALIIGARLLMPTFCERCKHCTDFSDVYLCQLGGSHEH